MYFMWLKKNEQEIYETNYQVGFETDVCENTSATNYIDEKSYEIYAKIA
jgi:hypothetical protein